MLKTTRLFQKLTLKAFRTNKNKVVRGSICRIDKMIVNLFKFKKSKNN